MTQVCYMCKYNRGISYRSLNIKLNALGPKDPDVGLTYLNLGAMFSVSEDFEKAANYQQQSYDIFKVGHVYYLNILEPALKTFLFSLFHLGMIAPKKMCYYLTAWIHPCSQIITHFFTMVNYIS